MCKISAKTIVRANERSIGTLRRYVDMHLPTCHSIVASVTYNGKLYSQEITLVEMRQAYGRALRLATNKLDK